MKINLIILSILISIFASSSSAAVIKIKSQGRAEITKDLKSCLKEAALDAKKKAVTKIMNKVGKGVNKTIINKVITDSEDAIRKFKILKKKDIGDGNCSLKARVSVDKKILLSLLNEQLTEKISQGSLSVGSVIRFIIDGKLSDNNGSDSQAALSKLNEELQKYEIETVDLSPLLMKYAAKQSRDWEAVALAEGEKRIVKKIDSSEALKQLIGTIKEVWNVAPNALRSFDAVAAGQVYVRSKGRDPQGPGYLAEVTSYVKVISLKNGTDLASSFVPGTIDGQTQSAANVEAMMLSIENNVSTIARGLTK